MDQPTLYRLWQLPHARAKFSPILAFNDLKTVRNVLDLGCGPGTNAKHFGGTHYLGIDHSQSYLAWAQRRYRRPFVLADLRDPAVAWPPVFDFVLLNSLLHHFRLEDVESLLHRVNNALAGDGNVHILELVAGSPGTVAGCLSRLDRGHHAMRVEEWRAIFETHFEPVFVLPYSIGCCGVPLWHMVYFKGRAKK